MEQIEDDSSEQVDDTKVFSYKLFRYIESDSLIT